tara:strand:+ start:769 stop:1029 length:261 start_codon:yes stop_codon:yes gene_type:complete
MRKVVYNACYGGFGLSEEALEKLGIKYCWDIKRHDPKLVAVVEELGPEKAGTRFSELKVVEVKGKYFIDEYDGFEAVVEPQDIEWL